jgi:hypothetical protein
VVLVCAAGRVWRDMVSDMRCEVLVRSVMSCIPRGVRAQTERDSTRVSQLHNTFPSCRSFEGPHSRSLSGGSYGAVSQGCRPRMRYRGEGRCLPEHVNKRLQFLPARFVGSGVDRLASAEAPSLAFDWLHDFAGMSAGYWSQFLLPLFWGSWHVSVLDIDF